VDRDGSAVFGSHDEETLRQLSDVAGLAARTALMADGHRGYVMPVGGVAAYRGHVSVCGVGFDIACLAGDERVVDLSGKDKPIRQLAESGEPFHTLACLPDGRVEVAAATARLTRVEAPLVEVELDDGARIRCTSDHRFMTRAGEYVQAKDLAPGLSLMPLRRKVDKDGYHFIRNNATGYWQRLHWLVFRCGLTMPAPDLEADDRLVIHHRDYDPANNRPENLEPMGRKAHDALHAEIRDLSHFNTPEFTARRLAAIREFWDSARKDEEFMERRRRTARRNGRAGARNHPEKYRDNGKRGARYLRRFNLDPATAAANCARWKVPRACPLCAAEVHGPNGLYRHAVAAHLTELESGTRVSRAGRKNPVAERLALGSGNHKVVRVNELGVREAVYCLSVPGYNNFALASGVFVHNCGNAAIRTDLRLEDGAHYLPEVANTIERTISFGIGRRNQAGDAPVDHPLFDDEAWEAVPRQHREGLRAKARDQLGTVGGGNHYVDVFVDEAGALWVGVHFGSRGFGHTVASAFLAMAQGERWGQRVPEVEVLLGLDSELGHDYWRLMELCGRYAYAGREWVARKVVEILGGHQLELVHNNHNFAWVEEHDGERFVVVRKGATPARPGQLGFVGGSMGDESVILRGAEPEPSSAAGEAQRAALYSTVHGAGRVMSRTVAAGKYRRGKQRWHCRGRDCDYSADRGGYHKVEGGPTPRCPACGHKLRLVRERVLVREGKVSQQMMDEWLLERGVILRGGGLDESPHAYRRLPDVLEAQGGTVEVVHTLTPLVVVMAGAEEYDPYRD
jgi:tRNA-splicing ligase RtcB